MSALTYHVKLLEWVDESARLTQPDRIVWCNGSEEEHERLVSEMLADGTLLRLSDRWPNSYLHRSAPSDVARTEHLTYIATDDPADAGPTNNWMSPEAARALLQPLFAGAMRGRTMYVVPYLMGPVGSPYARVGVELTDSPYVVVNMRIMTRVGKPALELLDAGADFVKGLHSLGDLDPERRHIAHFPEEKTIWSVGSGYGGNALLGKKCFALRIASSMARAEGWLAEHMLLLGLESPTGEQHYIAAAFPSACGKTNLAMLVAPATQKGWKVTTVGDDIAWMHIGADGRLWAVNPEAGFFGVAPGTSPKTNPNALAATQHNTIFTNVAVTEDGAPWWEGLSDPPPRLLDWRGAPWTPGGAKAAHPNSRFTSPASQCPSISARWQDPAGVPISAILFGGRRAKLAPLVYQAFDWEHGVFVGAGMASETTAAATGKVGVVRRDPMAMRPFCGYHIGDYFAHWLSLAQRAGAKLPPIFHVNWFRTGADGRFLWPGYGDNLRVLRWVVDRVEGRGEAVTTPIGYLPSEHAIDSAGLDLPQETMRELLRVEPGAWLEDLAEVEAFFAELGERCPPRLRAQLEAARERLRAV